MADERCVYENVLHDAKNLCVDIFVKWRTILMETSDQPDFMEERISLAVEQLFRWIAHDVETHIQLTTDLKAAITGVSENGACEHGARYKGLVEIDAFWNDKQLQTLLKGTRRAIQHRHLPVDIEGIAPLLDELKTVAKTEARERRE